MNYTEAQKFQARHQCAVCGSEPQLFPGPDRGYEVRCQKKEHQGFTRELTATEAWRGGKSIPLYIANRIEAKEEK